MARFLDDQTGPIDGLDKTANRRISNIEPQNDEGRFRSPRLRRCNPCEPEAALNLFIK